MAKSSNNLVNPNARDAMDRFKMEAASQVGVTLKQGYNGDLTSKQAGSIGGQMVRKMIEAYENGLKQGKYTESGRVSQSTPPLLHFSGHADAYSASSQLCQTFCTSSFSSKQSSIFCMFLMSPSSVSLM